jgi:hypothetical protein
MTAKVRLVTGAVRKVYNRKDGSEVTDLAQFEDKGEYVCCGGEKLKAVSRMYQSNISTSRYRQHQQQSQSQQQHYHYDFRGWCDYHSGDIVVVSFLLLVIVD